MGIFDTGPLKAHARKLLALADQEDETGRIGFAQQLRAQATKYLRECAAMNSDGDDQMDSNPDNR